MQMLQQNDCTMALILYVSRKYSFEYILVFKDCTRRTSTVTVTHLKTCRSFELRSNGFSMEIVAVKDKKRVFLSFPMCRHIRESRASKYFNNILWHTPICNVLNPVCYANEVLQMCDYAALDTKAKFGYKALLQTYGM